MKIMKFCVMTSFAFGLLFAAAAQQNVAKAAPSDIEYCHTLSRAYSYMWSTNEGMPVAEAFALGQCDTDTQKTIATLEKRMKDQKIELPPRQGVAQAPGSTDEAP
ncbi:MAG TPA: hypothetical protein VGO42_03645 [Reyranella sp.]|nr:hypothetical protein [Reyranella sp.]